MFSLGEGHRYYWYARSTDMRKGFDGLSGIVRDEMAGNPLSGDVYLFINRGRNRMKLLVWETDGLVLYYKRLERGRFELPDVSVDGKSAKISYEKLLLIVKGIELKSVKKKRRFRGVRTIKSG